MNLMYAQDTLLKYDCADTNRDSLCYIHACQVNVCITSAAQPHMHMCAIVTFIHAHIITKQTLACQVQAQVVVCQLGYKKAPVSMAGIQTMRKGCKGEYLKTHDCKGA